MGSGSSVPEMVWVFVSVAAVGLFWLGFRHPRRRRWLLPRRVVTRAPATAVDRQHRHLAAGGQLGEAAVAAAAGHLGDLLASGRLTDVERALVPGVGFAVQVQALVAVGTPEAGRILEQLLTRPLSRDPVEQAWYWADIAAGLRRLCYAPALPAVLRCATAATGTPAAPILAAESLAFSNFPNALNDLTSPVGRAAMRALTAASRGCRDGFCDPGSILGLGLGDLLATLSETAPRSADPWTTAALLEAQRLGRRLQSWVHLLPPGIQAVARRQGERLSRSAARRREWLSTAPERLLDRFPAAPAEEQTAILRCLFELRADVTRLFPTLPNVRTEWWGEAVACLTWSRSPAVRAMLAHQAGWCLASRWWRPRAAALLAALRGHASPEAERVLVLGTASRDAGVRRSAAAALGWWPPLTPAAVLAALRRLRSDPHAPARQAAVAALARLGERAALREVLAGLSSEEPSIRIATATQIATEELSWLWPDLQQATHSDDPSTALAAAEAVERLREHVLGPLG